MMILSNIGAIMVIFGNFGVFEYTDPSITTYAFIGLQGVGGILRDLFFNVAHWVFAFQYLNSAVMMVYIYDQLEQP
jgi:hypothetical protein